MPKKQKKHISALDQKNAYLLSFNSMKEVFEELFGDIRSVKEDFKDAKIYKQYKGVIVSKFNEYERNISIVIRSLSILIDNMSNRKDNDEFMDLEEIEEVEVKIRDITSTLKCHMSAFQSFYDDIYIMHQNIINKYSSDTECILDTLDQYIDDDYSDDDDWDSRTHDGQDDK